MTKTCRRCQQDLPISAFGRFRSASEGVAQVCCSCYRANVAALRGEATKRCKQCGMVKPFDAYSNNASEPDGLHPACRECNNSNVRKAYRKARDKAATRAADVCHE